MDFPVNEDGVLSYQRRYQMTQQQRINRFRQQRNFRSLRDPTFNYSGNTSERYSRDGADDEHSFLMRPTTPTPPMTGNRRWSPEVERQSMSSWRGSSGAMRRQQQVVQQRQPLLRSDGSNNSSSCGGGNRSREEDVVMVENCVSASPSVRNVPKPKFRNRTSFLCLTLLDRVSASTTTTTTSITTKARATKNHPGVINICLYHLWMT